MQDYNDTDLSLGAGDSSPGATFFGSSNHFQLTAAEDTGLSPFSAALVGLKGNGSSPDYAAGDSPGMGSEMRGLRLNSQFPSPVQGTVRLEDVMLPTEDLIGLQSSDESLFAQQQPFDIEPQVEHLGNGLLQAYPTPSHTLPPQPSYSPGGECQVFDFVWGWTLTVVNLTCYNWLEFPPLAPNLV